MRVYNHDHQYYVIFLVEEIGGDEQISTVYNLNTHEHSPTKSYLHAHGPHYLADEGTR